jgi:hypothetical protein
MRRSPALASPWLQRAEPLACADGDARAACSEKRSAPVPTARERCLLAAPRSDARLVTVSPRPPRPRPSPRRPAGLRREQLHAAAVRPLQNRPRLARRDGRDRRGRGRAVGGAGGRRGGGGASLLPSGHVRRAAADRAVRARPCGAAHRGRRARRARRGPPAPRRRRARGEGGQGGGSRDLRPALRLDTRPVPTSLALAPLLRVPGAHGVLVGAGHSCWCARNARASDARAAKSASSTVPHPPQLRGPRRGPGAAHRHPLASAPPRPPGTRHRASGAGAGAGARQQTPERRRAPPGASSTQGHPKRPGHGAGAGRAPRRRRRPQRR